MFKKKINKISNENGSSDYKSSLTVPFTVSFEDENPEKMKMIKKEIDRQKKEDPNNPQNILNLLQKNKKKNLKKLERSKSIPCIKHEDDITSNDGLVRIGRGIVATYQSLNIPLKDAETGEDIRPEFFTTNCEMANTIFVSSFLQSFNQESRNIFLRLARNGNNL